MLDEDRAGSELISPCFANGSGAVVEPRRDERRREGAGGKGVEGIAGDVEDVVLV